VTNRPKQIGTRGETAVVKALRAHGFTGAERRALAGSADLGDILVAPGVIAEVKWGKSAKAASLNDVEIWWKQTLAEKRNSRADVAFLVIQRNGIGEDRAHLSRAFFDLGDLWPMASGRVEVPLIQLIDLLRDKGWGDPL
jgi:hypothetical protein